MKNKELLDRAIEMLEIFSKNILSEMEHLERSGHVDLGKFKNEDGTSYRSAKILLSAAIHRNMNMFFPVKKEDVADFNNLLVV